MEYVIFLTISYATCNYIGQKFKLILKNRKLEVTLYQSTKPLNFLFCSNMSAIMPMSLSSNVIYIVKVRFIVFLNRELKTL